MSEEKLQKLIAEKTAAGLTPEQARRVATAQIEEDEQAAKAEKSAAKKKSGGKASAGKADPEGETPDPEAKK